MAVEKLTKAHGYRKGDAPRDVLTSGHYRAGTFALLLDSH